MCKKNSITNHLIGKKNSVNKCHDLRSFLFILAFCSDVHLTYSKKGIYLKIERQLYSSEFRIKVGGNTKSNQREETVMGESYQFTLFAGCFIRRTSI